MVLRGRLLPRGPGAAALSVAASGVAGAVASVPVAEALGNTARLSRASLDPPLKETFAIVTRDAATLSPAASAMLALVTEQMKTLHREYEPAVAG